MRNLDLNKGLVIWITGFSGAGKTTISKLLISELKEEGFPVVFLDGDELREVLSANRDSQFEYDRNERMILSRSYSSLAKLLAAQGLIVVVSTISLYKEIHQSNRDNIPNYFEVFIDVPLEVRQSRDPKGIYNRYSRGLEHNVAGLDLNADIPEFPNLRIEYADGASARDQMLEIKDSLKKVGLINV